MRYFGIDLGTTNSCIAVHSGGDADSAKVIPLRNGDVTLPSCVMYKDGKIVVGKEAFKNRWDTDHTVYSVKRLMGTQKQIKLKDSAGNEFKVTPVEVSAEILKELKRNAEVLYGEIKEIVITVPAYFGVEQRRDTKKAAELAGFKVLSLISEPTSASLAYGLNSEEQQDRILVYDLGGGTFDVSLLEFSKVEDSEFEMLGLSLGDKEDVVCKVISTYGDNHLGGDDLDSAVADIILNRLKNQCLDTYGCECEIPDYEIVREKLILVAENCKKSAVHDSQQMSIDVLIRGKQEKVFVGWDYNDYKAAFQPIFYKTMACVQQCLLTATRNDFSKIVLVGGSTKLEVLKEMLRETYPNKEILDTLNPDESVAIGASIKAAADKGANSTTVSDIVPMSIGVESVNVYGEGPAISGAFSAIIPKNSVLPAEASKSFTTNTDNQEIIEVRVYQGSSPMVINNTFLGKIEFTNIPKGKAGEVEVSVRFIVDVNGLLSVRVKTSAGEKEVRLSNILSPVANSDTLIAKRIKRHLTMLKSLDVTAEQRCKIEDVLNHCIEVDAIDAQCIRLLKYITDEYRVISANARTNIFSNIMAVQDDTME